jgi:hypothetical protein
MKLFVDNNRAYLVCLYFSMSFFYLSYVLGEDDPIPLLGYILALIIFIVVSHDSLLRFITKVRAEGKSAAGIIDVPFLIELTRSLHDAASIADVQQQLSTVLSEKLGIRKSIFKLTNELPPAFVADMAGPLFSGDAPSMVEMEFAETGTNMLLPVTDAGKVVCVILLERSDVRRPCTLQQLQVFDFLARQLGIVHGRNFSAQSAG